MGCRFAKGPLVFEAWMLHLRPETAGGDQLLQEVLLAKIPKCQRQAEGLPADTSAKEDWPTEC